MRKRLYVLLALFVLWPGVAHAQFWGFLQGLSGPGPFQGGGVSVRLFCVDPAGDVSPCLFGGDPRAGEQIVDLRVGVLTSGEDQRLHDVPNDSRPVHVFQTQGTYSYRLHAAFDVGVGVGLLHLSGAGVKSLNRVTLAPSIAFVPGALGSSGRWSRFIQLRLDGLYLPKGFDGADFDHPTSAFRTGHELLVGVNVVFDVWTLIQ